MLRHSNRAGARAHLIALALAAGTSILLAPSAFAWPFGGDGGSDVTIENFTAKPKDGGVVVIARAEFDNSNLSKDEIIALLTPETPQADRSALAQKFKADKVSIPSIEITSNDGGKINIHDVAANHIDAGKVEALEFSGIDASGTMVLLGLGQVWRASHARPGSRRRLEGDQRAEGGRSERAPEPPHLGIDRHRRSGYAERARQDDPFGSRVGRS